MKRTTLLLLMVVVSAVSWAGIIPYQNVGQVAPTTTFTASAAGNVVGYFYGFSAADTDFVRMTDLTTGRSSDFLLQNNATSIGYGADFGPVKKGDVLVFDMWNQSTNMILSSLPTRSQDGLNHAYAAPWPGGYADGQWIPAGTFTGMEDLASFQGSDFDYNDDQFIWTDVSSHSSATPEANSILLLAGGVLLLARKFFQ